MAYIFNAAGNGSAPLVVPVGGPPGQRGPAGADSTVPGPEGRQGPAGRDGAQGPAGAGAVSSRQADTSAPLWSAVVASDANRCIPADPSNPAHRGQVIGVTAYGGMAGGQVEIQSVGDLLGPVASFTEGSALFVGAGGILTSTPPASGWRQIVATAVSSSQIVVALGEARVISDQGAALILPEGGFAGPCALSQGAAAGAAGYVTPSANARAFLATMAGIVPDGLPPRRAQFLLALEARQAGSIQALLDALPSGPADPINVAWFHTVGVGPTSRLAQFAKSQLALTDAALIAVLASARLIQD